MFNKLPQNKETIVIRIAYYAIILTTEFLFQFLNAQNQDS